jgi:hypothetical protein
MKKLIIAAIAVAVVTPAHGRSVSVRGHVTKNGVYVAPHTRSAPNSSRLDNWSTKPNINPTTGKAGTVDPYKPVTPKPKY